MIIDLLSGVRIRQEIHSVWPWTNRPYLELKNLADEVGCWLLNCLIVAEELMNDGGTGEEC